MIARDPALAETPGFPRYFRIAGYRVNSYKVFLCVGLYLGPLMSAAVGERSWLWPRQLPPRCYALGVLAWYGLERAWQEPLRETTDLVWGRIRVNQVVGALLAIVADTGFLLRTI